jgi:hypothetical protein
VAVDGISVSLAQIIISEIGTDTPALGWGASVRKFPQEQNFCSWLGLAPHNDISGGKVLRSYTLKTHNRAGQAFRQAAASIVRADCAFGAFYARLKKPPGASQAVVATAHKIARLVYHILKFRMEYQTVTAGEYEQRYREREIRYLQHKAAHLGFTISLLIPPVQAVS